MFNGMDYSQLSSIVLSHNFDWVKHKYEIDLTHPGYQYVKRDGVNWEDVTNVEVQFDVENQVPLLILECYANPERFKSDWAENQPFISNYTFENDPRTDTLKVFRDKELIEEVQKVELVRDSKNARLTKIRLTVLAEVNIKWNFNQLNEFVKEQRNKKQSSQIENENTMVAEDNSELSS